MYVDNVLYGCDLSAHTLPASPVPTPVLSTDHVHCFAGEGPRARRARRRVEEARQRWRQPHSLRYLSELLLYCDEMEDVDDSIEMDVDGSSEPAKPKERLPDLAGTSRQTPSPTPPLFQSTTDMSLTWLQRQERAVRSGGFWLPDEAEKDLPMCSCMKEDGFGCAVAGCVPGGWEGAASVQHGTVIRFGCLAFVMSIAGQPGHEQLMRAVCAVDSPSSKASSTTSSKKEKAEAKS